jgi:hypothetical protein
VWVCKLWMMILILQEGWLLLCAQYKNSIYISIYICSAIQLQALILLFTT